MACSGRFHGISFQQAGATLAREEVKVMQFNKIGRAEKEHFL
jgi:hypothetical protein